MVIGRVRKELRTLRDSRPGARFEQAHERTKLDNDALRVGAVMLGVLLMLAAAATFWLPGPNFVLVLAGLGLVAGQSRWVAQRMDDAEVAGRRWHGDTWRVLPAWQRRVVVVLLWCAFFAAVLAVALLAWLLGLVPSWLPLVP